MRRQTLAGKVPNFLAMIQGPKAQPYRVQANSAAAAGLAVAEWVRDYETRARAQADTMYDINDAYRNAYAGAPRPK